MNKLLEPVVSYMDSVAWVIKASPLIGNIPVLGVGLTSENGILLVTPFRNDNDKPIYNFYGFGLTIDTLHTTPHMRLFADNMTDAILKYNELWEENIITEIFTHSGDNILFNEDGEYVLSTDVE